MFCSLLTRLISTTDHVTEGSPNEHVYRSWQKHNFVPPTRNSWIYFSFSASCFHRPSHLGQDALERGCVPCSVEAKTYQSVFQRVPRSLKLGPCQQFEELVSYPDCPCAEEWWCFWRSAFHEHLPYAYQQDSYKGCAQPHTRTPCLHAVTQVERQLGVRDVWSRLGEC